VVHGLVRVRPEELATVLTVAARIGESSRTEPGCREYRFAQDVADPAVLVLAGEWASEEALQAHLASPGFAAFVDVLGRAIEGNPEFTGFGVAASRPLFG
jgi:quinol monooxygenase YgiN